MSLGVVSHFALYIGCKGNFWIKGVITFGLTSFWLFPLESPNPVHFKITSLLWLQSKVISLFLQSLIDFSVPLHLTLLIFIGCVSSPHKLLPKTLLQLLFVLQLPFVTVVSNNTFTVDYLSISKF